MNRSLTGGLVVAVAAVARRPSTAPLAIDKTHLAGRTAVVTGAGSGSGRSLAVLLAQRGAAVRVADVNGPAAESVTQQIR